MPGVGPMPKTFNVAEGFKFKPSAGGVSGVKIEHRIGVNAPAEIIWESIHDVGDWPKWAAIYPKADGVVRIGSALALTLAIPGEAHRQIRPMVLDWVPNDQLHLRQSMFGGLLHSIRYLEIEKLGEENCIFSNGELFQGFLSGLISGQRARNLRRGFTQLGEALKERAEAAWREQTAAPTSSGT